MQLLFKQFFHVWKKTGLYALPIVNEILHYRSYYLRPDLLAGLNVALIAFPQSMIYALIAGLPVEHGLYGILLASIATALFSGSRILSMGPTNSTAVVIASGFIATGIQPENYQYALPILLLLTGVFLIMSAFLNIASIVQYVSKSVIWGYVCAVIIIMIVGQIHNAFGVELMLPHEEKATFPDTALATFIGLKNMNLLSVIICLLTTIFFYFWRNILPRAPIIALTVLSLAFITFILSHFFEIPLQTLHTTNISNWEISPINFNWNMVNNMAGTAFILSGICLIDGVTVLKTLPVHIEKRYNINQMIFGMGWSNIFCGLGSGMPSSCSLIRSSTNYISGSKTAVTSLFCALFCFLGIIIFEPFFKYIPKSGLSMLIILLGLDLFEKCPFQVILRSNFSDAIVFFITFITSFFFSLNISIFSGIFTSFALFLRKASNPTFNECFYENNQLKLKNIHSEKLKTGIAIIQAKGNLFFCSAELLREQIREICQRPQLKVIILKFCGVHSIDATYLLTLEELLQYVNNQNRQLILAEVEPQILKTLKRSHLSEKIRKDHIFEAEYQQNYSSTFKAIRFAKTLIDDTQMPIYIRNH